MAENKKSTMSGPLGILVVLAIEIIVFALVMAIYMIEGGWILIAEVVLVGLLVLASKKVPSVSKGLKEAFETHKVVMWVFAVILLLLPPYLLRDNAYWIFVIINALLFIIACLGLNLQLGSTGMMNLAGAAFMAFGAYTAGLFALNAGWPSWATLLAGAIVTGLFSILLFIPVLKTKGHYLALVTIAFQFMVVILVENMQFTGGPQGLKNIPLLSFFGYSFNNPLDLGFAVLPKYANFYYFILVLVFILAIASQRIYKSWVGVTAATIRDDEVAATTNGVKVNYWKLVIFVLGNCFIGLSGALFAHLIGFISPPNFVFDRSLIMVSVVILGGMDNIFGIIVGALLLITLPEKLRVINNFRFFIYGVVLIVMLIFQPKGILPFIPRDYKDLLEKAKAKLSAPAASKTGGE